MGLKKALSSSLGGKYIMAITGLGLFGFVIGHMAGNLQVFLGQDALNKYAQTLKNTPLLLWPTRIGLLLFFVFHIILAFRLSKKSSEARPVGYVCKNTVQATSASKYMLLTGLTILVFVVYHLLHFTLGVTDPEHFALTDLQGRHDVYRMVILGFQNVLVSVFYIVSQLMLGWHLWHGSTSLFQSLGLNHPYYWPRITAVCKTLVIIVVVGNISIPVSILLGLIGLPTSGAS